ncbi:MAG TPA: hypothetical protein PKA63_12010 [Oligoflexia bacterium]|nr:hypothetical protein [Oligoflexia bacterium]HMP49379.1 hypothetical protein [Oligoflexia bacterium]
MNEHVRKKLTSSEAFCSKLEPSLESEINNPVKFLAPLSLLILYLAIILGFLVTATGLYKNPHVFVEGAWSDYNSKKQLILFIACFSLIQYFFSSILVFYRKFSPALSLLTFPIIFISASCGIHSWIIPALILYGSFCLGYLILEGNSFDNPNQIKLLSNFSSKDILVQVISCLLLGISSYMLIIGLLVHFPVNYSFTYLILLIVPIIVAGKQGLKTLSALFINDSFFVKPEKTALVCYTLLSSLLMIHTVQVCRPEMMMDALGIHLLVPEFIKNNHYWSFDVSQFVFAVMPMGADWVYAMANMLGDEYSVRTLNMSFMLITALVINSWFINIKQSYTPLLASALYLSSPLVFTETGSLFVDNLWALLLIGAFHATYRFITTNHYKSLIIAGALSGAAMSIKVTSIFFIFFTALTALPLIMLRLIKPLPYKNIAPYILASISTLLLYGAYPYIYAWTTTQNPVFPFYNAFFKSPYYDSTQSFSQPTYMLPLSIKALYDMTFKSSKFLEAIDGALGLQFLLFFPLVFLAGVFGRSRFFLMTFTIAWGYFLLVYPFQAYLRYLFPSFVMQSLLIAYALWLIEIHGKKYLALLSPVILFIIAINIWCAPAGLWLYRNFPITETLRGKQEEELRFKVPQRLLIESLNSTYGNNSRVLSLDQNSAIAAGIRGEAFVNAWYNDRIYRLMQRILSPNDLLAIIKEYNISHLMSGHEAGLSLPVREFLSSYGTEESRIGSSVLYRINQKLLPRVELLTNPNLLHPLSDGWTVEGDPKLIEQNNSGALIGENSRIHQAVSVDPGAEYELKITARSDTASTLLRLQTNWISETGELLSFNIEPVECENVFTDHVAIMKAPPNASIGIIYVLPHRPEDDNIWIKAVRFQR